MTGDRIGAVGIYLSWFSLLFVEDGEDDVYNVCDDDDRESLVYVVREFDIKFIRVNNVEA